MRNDGQSVDLSLVESAKVQNTAMCPELCVPVRHNTPIPQFRCPYGWPNVKLTPENPGVHLVLLTKIWILLVHLVKKTPEHLCLAAGVRAPFDLDRPGRSDSSVLTAAH